jgi:type IV pilus assembly protein PilE
MNKKQQLGFTLVEMMITVAIVGILASIAVPNYKNSIRKSRREDAKGALVSFANAMERHYTEVSTYCDAADLDTGTPIPDCGDLAKMDTESPAIYAKQSPIDGATKYYDLLIYAVSANTYELHARPIFMSDQKNDECGELKLDHTGKKWADKAGCW